MNAAGLRGVLRAQGRIRGLGRGQQALRRVTPRRQAVGVQPLGLHALHVGPGAAAAGAHAAGAVEAPWRALAAAGRAAEAAAGQRQQRADHGDEEAPEAEEAEEHGVQGPLPGPAADGERVGPRKEVKAMQMTYHAPYR